MKEVKCPMCGKVIGVSITDGYMPSPLGGIEMCHEKLDYRKASHFFWSAKRCTGVLCKACAKTKFPEMRYFAVEYFDSHGKKDRLYGGDYGRGEYLNREDAEAKAKEWSARYGRKYWVEEHKV